MRTDTLEQRISIKAEPMVVYEAFMDSTKHREFTGFAAEIENMEGGKFITCGNRNRGYTLFLESGQRIIQAWTQKGFPDNQYSIIDLKFTEPEPGITEIIFTQTGIPEGCLEWLKPGWQETYWEPLKDHLETGTVKPLQE